MSNYQSKELSNCDRHIQHYPQGTPVKITKGSLKGCRGEISGCTSDRIYFVGLNSCQADKSTYSPIGLYLPHEFEVSD